MYLFKIGEKTAEICCIDDTITVTKSLTVTFGEFGGHSVPRGDPYGPIFAIVSVHTHRSGLDSNMTYAD